MSKHGSTRINILISSMTPNCTSKNALLIQTELSFLLRLVYIIMLTEEEHIKIVNFMTHRVWVVM